MPDRSRLITVASVAIAKNTAAVPPKAVMISEGPFLKPSTTPTGATASGP